jgi:hypothetical protein
MGPGIENIILGGRTRILRAHGILATTDKTFKSTDFLY